MVRQGKHRKRTKRRSNRAGMMGGPPPPYQKPTGAPPPYEHPPSYDKSQRELMFPRGIDEGRIIQLENDIKTIKREISSIDEGRIIQLESDIRAIKREISEIRKACLSHKSSKKRTKKSK